MRISDWSSDVCSSDLKLGCSPPFISDVEHGRRFPSEPMLEEMARLLKLNLAALKQHDKRAPLDEIKRMTEQDPGYAFAFSTLLDRKLSPEELLPLVIKSKPPPKGGRSEERRVGTEVSTRVDTGGRP